MNTAMDIKQHVNVAQTKLLYIQAVLALSIAACATTGGPYVTSGSTPNLAGTRWIVTRIDGNAPVREGALHADFGVDGRVNGDSGCNSFSGPYLQNSSTVQIGELLSTRRACENSDRQKQEARMLAILQGATSARMDHGQLSLRGNNGTLLLSPGATAGIAYAYPNAPPKRVQFDCEGAGLTVQFEPGRAEMSWKGGQDVLDQRPAASGIWYESSHNTLRGKLQDLKWKSEGHSARSCRELS